MARILSVIDASSEKTKKPMDMKYPVSFDKNTYRHIN